MPVKQRGNRFEVAFAYQGKRVRKLLPTEAEAKQFEVLARQALILGKPVPETESNGSTSYTLKQAAERAFKLHWKGKASESKNQYYIKRWCDALGEKMPVADITKDHIDQFSLDLIDKGSSDGTVNRHLSAISVILKEARDAGKLKSVPVIKKRKEKKGRIRWVTADEERQIIATLQVWGSDDLLDAFIVSIDTGLRAGELSRLVSADVLAEGVYVRESKNGEPRLIPLTNRARAVLQARAKVSQGGTLFPSKKYWYRAKWEKLMAHLDLEDVVWHTLRHTTCSRLVQQGMPLKHVQEWMGHKTIITTMRYAHLAPKSLASGVNLLEEYVA